MAVVEKVAKALEDEVVAKVAKVKVSNTLVEARKEVKLLKAKVRSAKVKVDIAKEKLEAVKA